jgi:hypothetical protein
MIPRHIRHSEGNFPSNSINSVKIFRQAETEMWLLRKPSDILVVSDE